MSAPEGRREITRTVCKGARRVRSICKTCSSRGSIRLPQADYACHDCGNLRCIRCGGSGVEIIDG